jgi:hypothetical protein
MFKCTDLQTRQMMCDKYQNAFTPTTFKRFTQIQEIPEEKTMLKMAVFWVVAPSSLVEVYRRFRSACYLHHQGSSLYQTTRRYNPEDSHLILVIVRT